MTAKEQERISIASHTCQKLPPSNLNIYTRAAQDEQEERWVRKLAASRHGPADWIFHAKIVVHSWDGERVEAIAKNLDCSSQTVRRRLHRFATEGIEGLGDRLSAGLPRRLTTEDDSRIIALVRQAPPGRLERRADEMVAREVLSELKQHSGKSAILLLC